jgi:hypothetical protein
MTFAPVPGVSEHARIRFVQRFGADPPRAAWHDAVLAIIERRALLLAASRSDGREAYRVAIGPIETTVWWCSATAQIITVLDTGHRMLNPQRMVIRDAQRRGGGTRPTYKRQRVRPEDWQ